MRKSLFVFALVGVAQLSLASYELALVADFWGKKIDRYDPVSGAYLGSFGGNFLVNPSDVSVDQTNGLAYVADQGDSRMSVFNYSTGELVLQEAMLAGIPPIVLPFGGAANRVIHGNTGLVAQDVRGYSEAIAFLYNNPVVRARLGTAANDYARKE
ncbi:MAG: hypothetical protein K8R88_00715, partial [Armatimonadetes bacterium]|nr:hypothetical protein [Armatimonadota bacterium]